MPSLNTMKCVSIIRTISLACLLQERKDVEDDREEAER